MSEEPIAADAQPSVARPPQQSRSRASLERMLNAAEALLVEHGSDGFTLTDVSRVGQVSIGSIYNRFAGKDELIQAVHARLMERIAKDQVRIVMRARSRSRSPVAHVRAIIEELGEFLADHAHLMRPMMLRAAFDPVVQDQGRFAHDAMADAIAAELLTYRTMMTQGEPERAVRAAIRISYASFARDLGFGMTEEPQRETGWDELKADVSDMTARYLFGRLDSEASAD